MKKEHLDCPFCGEEIEAQSSTCPFCGETLNQKPEPAKPEFKDVPAQEPTTPEAGGADTLTAGQRIGRKLGHSVEVATAFLVDHAVILGQNVVDQGKKIKDAGIRNTVSDFSAAASARAKEVKALGWKGVVEKFRTDRQWRITGIVALSIVVVVFGLVLWGCRAGGR